MKKSFFLGALLVCGLAVTSCDKESEGSTFTTTNLIPSYTLFTEASGSSAPFVSVGNYNYILEYPDNVITLKVSSMAAPAGTTLSFATDPVTFQHGYMDMGDDVKAEVLKFGPLSTTTNSAVTDLKCTLSQAAYAPADVQVPGYENRFSPKMGHYTVMQYKYNSWNARTFWPDMTFKGTTKTSGTGVTEGFSSTASSYRIVMRRNEDQSLTNKADLIIYNANFAAAMPPLTIVVKDLDLEFNAAGYQVKGENVVPSMIEAGQLLPAPYFVFNDIVMFVDGDLTKMNARFTVGGRYFGEFVGSSIKD